MHVDLYIMYITMSHYKLLMYVNTGYAEFQLMHKNEKMKINRKKNPSILDDLNCIYRNTLFNIFQFSWYLLWCY
jgi:sulfur relay (sulfurtransferase) DsrC/TusE family protein